MIRWYEQSSDGSTEPVTMECTEAEAIRRARKSAAKHGHTYTSDEEALLDFITVHWAWRTE